MQLVTVQHVLKLELERELGLELVLSLSVQLVTVQHVLELKLKLECAARHCV